MASPDSFRKDFTHLPILLFQRNEGMAKPGAPSFFSASAYAARSVSILQTWTYKPQKRQVVSAFALTYIRARCRAARQRPTILDPEWPAGARDRDRPPLPPASSRSCRSEERRVGKE